MHYLLFGHGGSGNHGCEAIIRTTISMLPPDSEIEVYSADVKKDEQYGAASLAVFNQTRTRRNHPVRYKICKAIFKLTRNPKALNHFALADAFKTMNAVCLSVGGDNYCNGEPERHVDRNKELSKHNKTVLWGCSITPELLNIPDIVKDMNRYTLITARESLTYNALIEAGVKNAVLLPDPAFSLPVEAVKLPDIFDKGDVVGLNISPLVMKYEKDNNILMANVCALMDHILKETEFNIALIPHVLLSGNNDLIPLRILFDRYRSIGRVSIIDDDDSLNCCQLKYIISKCRFMIAARTHASIAAYSTCVPTLVLGYSIKSKGIATDIFGTHENYVISVDEIKEENELTDAFKWIMNNETAIRIHYEKFMPEYNKNALLASEHLRRVG